MAARSTLLSLDLIGLGYLGEQNVICNNMSVKEYAKSPLLCSFMLM